MEKPSHTRRLCSKSCLITLLHQHINKKIKRKKKLNKLITIHSQEVGEFSYHLEFGNIDGKERRSTKKRGS
ncbi:hypothetical protein PRUPE_8G271900 [Prunus persica]|uniref:Uncharacterized protein n=1 Tax=Prunus persica TaxID=3760 RepID=A0A251N463_PRUPE|nr:hypothetical protein PRUPE_8G271900 [Prunus persica]